MSLKIKTGRFVLIVKMSFKKSQIWYSDFILGLAIFIIIFLVSVKYVTEHYTLARESSDEIIYTGKIISESIMSNGVPENWNQTNVFRIGLTNGNQILNLTKVYYFANLTETQYTRTKSLFGSRYDYLVYFKNNNNVTLNFTKKYIGKPGQTRDSVISLDLKNLIKINRYIVLKRGQPNLTAEIIEMNIFLWEEN